ncbi:MAG: leucine-rich repeat domain-containing protein [Limisphaerales bacterium]
MKTNLCLFRCLKTAVLALVLALPLSGWAQFNYFIYDGAATITEYTGSGGAVTIPSTLGGFPVKEIGSYAFNNTIYVNYSLTSVTFPDSVTDIDDHAFEYCSGLTNVAFGSGLVSMGLDAFIFCDSLPSVSLPASATNLGPGVFSSCGSLTNISLPPTLSRISPALLAGCNLGTVAIPSSVTSIDDEAFSGCGNLTNIALPAGVTNIGNLAFGYCHSLKGLAIPQNVANIGDGAFRSCVALTNISIPAGVLNIGAQAFWYCTGLTNISVSPLNPNYSSVEGVLFDKAVTTIEQYPGGRAGAYTLPSSVTNIPAYGFYYSPFLTSVTIPGGVKQIGENAFDYMDALTNVSLSEGLASIGNYAFAGTGLYHLILPASLTNIGYGAFSACTNLTSVTIPPRVLDLGYTFGGDLNLHDAYLLGNAPTINGMDGSLDYSCFALATGTAHYLPGTTGWGTNFGGFSTMLAPYPLHPQISEQSSGIQSNHFEFGINWVPDTYVVVEASTNLVNWIPIATNTLGAGKNAFADGSWTNYHQRFYRVHSF